MKSHNLMLYRSVALAYLVLTHLRFYAVFCVQEPVTLDLKSIRVPREIERKTDVKTWTIHKVRNPEKHRIGDVTYGSETIMPDPNEEILHRKVYSKTFRRVSERILVKIITKYKTDLHTMEFMIQTRADEVHCSMIVREPLDIDISNIDKTILKKTTYCNNWNQFEIVQELALNYRIGNISDGGVPIVTDAENKNIRVRYIHVSKMSFMDVFVRGCIPFIPSPSPRVVRVFTYYYGGERSFDEFVETRQGRVKTYTELIREPVELNLAARNFRHFRVHNQDEETVAYLISDEFNTKRRIGSVCNGPIPIVKDESNIRYRSVYTIRGDKRFQKVDVKTCYDRGECERCKYIRQGDEYIKHECKFDKRQDRLLGHQQNLFGSTEEVDEVTKTNRYLTKVAYFRPTEMAVNDIVLDIEVAESAHFDVDILPNCNGLYFSLRGGFVGKKLNLKIVNGDSFVATVHLERTNTVEVIVKANARGEKRVMVLVKCGLELQKSHEILLIDSLKHTSLYKTKRVYRRTEESSISPNKGTEMVDVILN